MKSLEQGMGLNELSIKKHSRYFFLSICYGAAYTILPWTLQIIISAPVRIEFQFTFTPWKKNRR